MGVYTKTGDKGTTGLLTGERVEKNSVRVDAYGNVDEISSALGMARAFCKNEFVVSTLLDLQKTNMMVMADLASLTGDRYITADNVAALEKIIDRIEAELPPLRSFLVSGATQGGAMLDFARTVTRRAERKVLTLAQTEEVNNHVLIFLNRLSDLCFVLMRYEEH